METKQENTVEVEPLDPAVFDQVQKEMIDKKQAEIADLEHSISNIQFSMDRLQTQYMEKKRILDNRLAELKKIQGTTFESLLKKA